MIDSYFDTQSFKDPIKTFLTQKYWYSLEGGKRHRSDIFLKENNIDMFDDFIGLEGKDDANFYSVSDGEMRKWDENGLIYGEWYFYLDPETRIFQRDVYTILDLLSQVGGIFSLLQSLCVVLVGLYAERMIYFTVLSK